jgi:hypothetical protein
MHTLKSRSLIWRKHTTKIIYKIFVVTAILLYDPSSNTRNTTNEPSPIQLATGRHLCGLRCCCPAGPVGLARLTKGNHHDIRAGLTREYRSVAGTDRN